MKDNPEVYRQEWYDRMLGLAKNKPLALSECSVLLSEEILKKQPSWVWMMAWADLLLKSNTKEEIIKTYNSKRMMTREKLLRFME